MSQRLIASAVLIAAGAGAGYTIALLAPQLRPTPVSSAEKASGSHGGHDDHEGHDHDHDQDAGAGELVLSDQARRNLKLVVEPVRKSDLWRSIIVPGVIAEQPGHSERRITMNMNGIVSHVNVLPGQSVKPGDPLMEVQTTGEMLANAQSSLLKTIQDQELVEAEMKRLEPLTLDGSVPGTRLLEKQYEKQRLASLQMVQIQELLVRGLSQQQVDQIMRTKVLLRSFTVRVPDDDGSQKRSAANAIDLVYTVEDLDVFPGKLLQPGDDICTLGLHTDLRIVGMAFQKDSELINQVIGDARPVAAILEESQGGRVEFKDLRIQYSDNVVDAKTRQLRFYLPIKNEVVRDFENSDGISFRTWRFKPGQRVQLRVPVELWKDQLVLPLDAVVKEGPEAFVFRENGSLMERVAVTLLYEDSQYAVLADDGSLFPNDPLAMNDAYQLNLAFRKAQGSGVDLHAGHDHDH